jgi:hypothetical protein
LLHPYLCFKLDNIGFRFGSMPNFGAQNCQYTTEVDAR